MRLAVVGSPVAHSLSPVMHEAALESVGLAGSYEAWDVDEAGFAGVISSLRSGELDGANVTMPHKGLAFGSCDRHSSLAQRTGAVNTLTMRRAELVGSNTDVIGIQSAWEWAELPTDVPAVVIGSGGAAAAAVVAIANRPLMVSARRSDMVAALLQRAGVEAVAIDWGDPLPPSVVVNATPIGMKGEVLPEEVLNAAVGLFDMAYGSRATPAVSLLRGSGLPVAEGLDMLVGQAVASFEIWTGRTVDPGVMRAAADAELRRREELQK